MSSISLTSTHVFAFQDSFDIFAIFSPPTYAQVCQATVQEWIQYAVDKNKEAPLFNRVLTSLKFSKNEKRLLKKMRKTAVPKDKLTSSYTYEYFRVFVEDSYLSEPVVMYSSQQFAVLRIRGSLDSRISMAVNPIIRFLYQFDGYVGIVSEDMANFSRTGKCLTHPQQTKIYGIRYAESLLLELLQTKDEFAEGELQLITHIISRYRNITTPIKKKNPLFAAICNSSLSLDLRLIAVQRSTNLELLNSLLQNQELSQFARKRLKEILATKEVDQSHYLVPRVISPLSTETVQAQLLKQFANIDRADRLSQKLAKIMIRVRKNTYSQRCIAPDGYVGVVCQSVSAGNSLDIIVLPGQEPFETLRVRTSRDVREIYNPGSFFVVWLAEIPKPRDDYYISHSNTLLPISFNY